ncbi:MULTISPECIES: neutral zinc metallopeptidase [unclassified Devosia]|uniref:KPN_02809 family neutral zinc metallopeptidase n=1 Tax=unclassified Devosia TaxID=196773 RepID=UPI0015F922CC|nr:MULTISPECIES: neutral zinc metallopeptidase [unclassified Devosia]MBJ6986728.1 zinc metallopeptidase [Devosia sp. MC521]MBK1793865.1 zinc metallopeptidase [Devosia sp. WQ 349K1]QMW61760.1 zinc metallopeptidase [Devosia sp. MC521]
MKWRGRERSSNVQDLRGQRGGGGLGGGFGQGQRGGFRIPMGGGGGGGGKGGISGLIGIVVVLGIIWFATGQNPLDMLAGGSGAGSNFAPSASSSRQLPAEGEDELADFVAVVVRETEDLWNAEFAKIGEDYPEPNVVLFTNAVSTGCGAADSSVGPFYCPADSKVYIDLSFYDELHRKFGAPGDFAQAYVLAHEVGHHVQNLTGVLPQFNQRRASMSQEQANAYSVRVELQADCYAGVWANHAGQQNLLEGGDIDEALNAANQIGDDTLQKRMQGFAVPKTFNHGTSAQRKDWFQRGYETGDPGACDTFTGNV